MEISGSAPELLAYLFQKYSRIKGREPQNGGAIFWRYTEFPDETFIAYSDILGNDTAAISIERPRDWGSDSAERSLPSHRWSNIDGFSDHEIAKLNTFLNNNEEIIFDFARNPENRWKTARCQRLSGSMTLS
ncbi:hypothetical protein [Enorma phocaeensis]|uniref:hypothetical protein n=1 Tax=Enorma phocaeensis TaxID=1871019 RepID=UPI000C84542E|nr:hypothetical protein [Enorma phocaeensis]